MDVAMTVTLQEARLMLDVLARVAALGSAHSDLLNAPEYAALMRKFGRVYAQLYKAPDNDNGGER